MFWIFLVKFYSLKKSDRAWWNIEAFVQPALPRWLNLFDYIDLDTGRLHIVRWPLQNLAKRSWVQPVFEHSACFHPLYHDGGIRCLAVRPRVQVKNCIPPPSHFSYFCLLSDEGKVSKPKYTVQLNTVYLSDNWPPDKEIWDKKEWQRFRFTVFTERPAINTSSNSNKCI